MRKTCDAIYVGSFDMPTNGHIQLIELGAELFDGLLVLVAVNPGKTPWFTPEERVRMLKESIAARPNAPKNVGVRILPAKMYTAVYASEADFNYLLRGLRNGTDFEAEHDMLEMNDHIIRSLSTSPLQTVLLALDKHSSILSSSNVKALVGPDNWERVVAGLVPPPVLAALKRRQYADRA